jgi:dTDP-glucose 4,6-dehydratase
MKRLLLTGGAGSIGIHVISHVMTNTDWEIVLLSSFHHKGYRDRLLKLYADHPEWKPRITEYEHNLTCPVSPELKKKIGHDIDYIWHLAAMSDVGFSIENPVWTIQNNINSTLVMLELARELQPKQFLYFSTDEVYGPVMRDENGTLGAHAEWSTHRPSNAYAASKAASEDICYSYWRSYGVPLIVTNTMNNFGEMQSSSKYPVIVQKKLEAGEKVIIHGDPNGEPGSRFYIHSRNVADALLHIAKQGVKLHRAGEMDEPLRYHIVGERPLTNLELAKLIADLMGKELDFEYLDFHSYNPAHDIHYGLEDNTLRASGWKQPRSLEESLADVIRWQQDNPEWIQ